MVSGFGENVLHHYNFLYSLIFIFSTNRARQKRIWYTNAGFIPLAFVHNFAELQIRGNKDNSGISFQYFSMKTCCGHSLEPS